MFRLITSNDATRLAHALGKRLAVPRDNPLVPARVLVPQAGLKRWLQVRLAEQLGIVANIAFTPPAQFAWELLHAAQPGLPAQSPFEVDVLRWHLYALLAAPLDGTALAPLRAYLDADGDPLRRHALSLALARAYERMQGYRREVLLAWERGAAADDWQAEVWRRVRLRLGGASRAALVDDWLRRFDAGDPHGEVRDPPAPPGLPAHLACFACANVSPDVLRMLAVAGRHCDVDFYLPLPSREYLGDTPTRRAEVRARLQEKADGNPLILAQGGALAEFVELLYGYQYVQPGEEVEAFDDLSDRTTLLGRVRADILEHATPPVTDRGAALPDDSLQFHACHTPLREVQTLHDALLAMLADPRFEPPLQPRDIAVMLPDVAAYAPAIAAVFGGTAREDPRWLPFNLGDTGAAAVHPVARLFLDLLDAPSSRWEAGALVDVLAVPGVMRRLGIDADVVARLAFRLREAGVRWGEDEHARAGCGDYREFSWAFGIDRLLAGFACGDDADVRIGGVAPLAGSDAALAAGLDAVLGVTQVWRGIRACARRTQPAAAWQRTLNHFLDELYQPDPRDLAESRALERIRDALARLAHACAAVDPQPELPFADVRACLHEALAAPDPQQRLFAGGVTFCGMVPLRVVPFRVIGLLGMDATAFPRHEANGLDPLLRDRRGGRAQRGDRDVRADDRLLFLQLLAAARDAFYVSWIGRDARTNEDRPPSAVVSELIDLVREHYLSPPADDGARQRRDALLPRLEPLHPFDPGLFGAGPAPARSFHAEWLPAARAPRRRVDGPAPFVAGDVAAAGEPAPGLTLAQLRRFFDDPARGFLEGALQLRLPREPEDAADLEPLQPDHPLLRYDLAARLLARGGDAAEQQARLRAEARLPPGALADAAMASARARAEMLQAAIAAFTRGGAELEPAPVRLAIADTTLEGAVDGRYATGLLRWSPAGFRGRRVLRAWLDTLVLAAANGTAATCRFLWIDGHKVQARDIGVADAAAARAQLGHLIDAYRAGRRQPLPLFPEASAKAFGLDKVKGARDTADQRGAFVDALAAIAGKADDDGDFADASDFDRPSVRIAWRGIDFAPPDPSLAARLHDAACTLFPRLRPVPKGQP